VLCKHAPDAARRVADGLKHIIFGLAFVAVGYVILATVTNVGGRYVGICMIACTNMAVIPFLAYRTATVTGATSTAIATGGV
jgi:hypothetical protein